MLALTALYGFLTFGFVTLLGIALLKDHGLSQVLVWILASLVALSICCGLIRRVYWLRVPLLLLGYILVATGILIGLLLVLAARSEFPKVTVVVLTVEGKDLSALLCVLLVLIGVIHILLLGKWRKQGPLVRQDPTRWSP